MTDTNNTNDKKKPLPIKISAIIIVVVSVVGIGFFASAALYGVYNNDLLNDGTIQNNRYPHLNTYVIIQLVLHLSLLISAIFLLMLKKIGYYIYITSLFAMLISELFFTHEHILSHIMLGSVLGIILTIYYSRYK